MRGSGEEAEASLGFGVLAQLLANAPIPPSSGLAAVLRGGERPIDPLMAGAAMVGLLGQLQDPDPVLLVVDDVSWADRPSLQALTFALRRLRVDRVLALLVTRDGADPRLPEGLRRLLSAQDTLHLSLGELPADQLRQLATRLGAGPLSARAAARLHAHTEGNPLHARALLEQLPSGVLDDPTAPLPAPRSFALLVLARLAECTAETQELVAAASVLGLRCPLHQAAALARLEDPLPAWEQAIAAGLLIEELPVGTRTVRFAHPLIHAAITQQLGVARRAALHSRAADLAEDEPTRLGHRTAAAHGPDAQLAADLARLGRRRVSSGDWTGAAGHLTAAARLSPDRAGYEQLSLEAAEAKLLAGDPVDAAALATEVRALAAGGWRSYLLGRLAYVGGRLTEAEALLDDAWTRCDPNSDPALAARIAVHLAMLCVFCGRGQETVEWADVALRLSSAHAAHDLIRYIRLVGLGMTGQAEAALASLQDLPEPALAAVAELDLVLGRGRLRIWSDDLAGAYQDVVALLSVAPERSVEFQVLVTGILVEVEYRLGRWDNATAHGGLAVSIATDAEHASLAPFCHATAALVPAARGQWAQAAAHVAAARPSDPEHLAALAYTASAQAHLATARGDPPGVVAALQPVLAMQRTDGAYEPGIVRWQDLLVDALVVLRRYEQAEAILTSFEARAADRRLHSSLTAAARARGNLAAAGGHTAAAAAAFQTGLDHAAQVDMPFERARLELAYGAFLRRTGKRAAAAPHLEAAQDVFDRLSAHPYRQRCARELAACGRSPTRSRAPDPTRLTPQEQAVAGLVARGLTNQQVARELVVSIKTVEYHLAHVYAKLQVRSRDQLADRLSDL